jgi:hypothetical protein
MCVAWVAWVVNATFPGPAARPERPERPERPDHTPAPELRTGWVATLSVKGAAVAAEMQGGALASRQE